MLPLEKEYVFHEFHSPKLEDADFDGKFFDLFRSMGTTDKDELIAEFQAVIGNNINKEQGIFFLEMNNW